MGRLQGMEEATREIVRGLSCHYELEGRTIPERVTKAVEGIKAVSQKRWKTGKGATDPYHAQLWIFGNAVGEACWLRPSCGGEKEGSCERKDPNRSILKRATAAELVGPSRLSTHDAELSWLRNSSIHRRGRCAGKHISRRQDRERYSGPGAAFRRSSTRDPKEANPRLVAGWATASRSVGAGSPRSLRHETPNRVVVLRYHGDYPPLRCAEPIFLNCADDPGDRHSIQHQSRLFAPVEGVAATSDLNRISNFDR